LTAEYGPAVRPAARRTGLIGDSGRHADGRQHRHYRRYGGNHGTDFPAHHAAQWLQPGTGQRYHLCHRYPGADYSALDRPDYSGRCAVQRLPAGSAAAGDFQPRQHLGGRPVRRCADSRFTAGRCLSAVCRGYCPVAPTGRTGGADRPPVDRAFVLALLRGLLPPLVLIIAVLGSILAGIATPTEAAGIGAAGALLLAVLYGEFSVKRLREVLDATL